MKKLFAKISLAFLLSFSFALSVSAATVNTGVSVQNYMRYDNGAITPINTTYDFGSVTRPWENGYFTTLTAGTLAVSGVVTGNLDMDGYTLILDADGDTTLDAAVDDIVDITLGSSTGTVAIGDGTYSWTGTPQLGVEGDTEFTGNQNLGGDLSLVSGGIITSTVDGNVSLIPSGTGFVIVGDAGVTSHSFATNDDLFVSGRIEADGAVFLDSTVDIGNTLTVTANQTLSGNLTLSSGGTIQSDLDGNITIAPNGTGDVGFTLDSDTQIVASYSGTGTTTYWTGAFGTPTTLDAGSSLIGHSIDLSTNVTADAGGNAITGLQMTVPNGGASTTIGLSILGAPDVGASIAGATTDLTSGANEDFRIVPNGTGIVQIGDAGTQGSLTTPTNDDLYVSGRFELDGAAFFGSTAIFAQTITAQSNIRVNSNAVLFLGTGNEAGIEYDTTSAIDTVHFYVPTSSLAAVFGNIGYNLQDYDHPLQSNPTFFIQDNTNPSVTNNKWGGLVHDTNGFVLTSGANTGAGSSPATVDNYIAIAPRGTTQFKVTGNGGTVFTPTSTQNIVATTGITATMLARVIRIQGSGGVVNITASPQIVDGEDGQIINIQGDSDTNTVQFDDGTGLALSAATSFTMGKGDMLQLTYDLGDDLWYEISRSDN